MLNITQLDQLVVPKTLKLSFHQADGGTVEADISVKFKILPNSKALALAEQSDGDLLKAMLAGWEGIADGEGGDLPFTPENIARLADYQPLKMALVQAYFAAASEALTKN